MSAIPRYTCKDYREEMLLVNLRIQLNREDISAEERKRIEREIEKVKKRMGMD